jgi:transposase
VQVQRFLRAQREQRKWSELATVRFETGPGEQAQVDYGQLKVWIGTQWEKVHLFVFTLGYSRRLYAHAYHHERLTTLLDGHERAFRWFGGVTLSCLYDNPRNLVLGRREHKCGIRSSRISPATTVSPRAPASRIGRGPRAKLKVA